MQTLRFGKFHFLHLLFEGNWNVSNDSTHDFQTSHGFSTDLQVLRVNSEELWISFNHRFCMTIWKKNMPHHGKSSKGRYSFPVMMSKEKEHPKKQTPGKKGSGSFPIMQVTSLSTLSTVGLFYFLLETCFQPGRLSHSHRTQPKGPKELALW